MDKHTVDVSAQTVPRDLEAVGAASSRKRETQPVLLQSHIEKRLA
jgi:hypothetical protein